MLRALFRSLREQLQTGPIGILNAPWSTPAPARPRHGRAQPRLLAEPPRFSLPCSRRGPSPAPRTARAAFRFLDLGRRDGREPQSIRHRQPTTIDRLSFPSRPSGLRCCSFVISVQVTDRHGFDPASLPAFIQESNTPGFQLIVGPHIHWLALNVSTEFRAGPIAAASEDPIV